MSDRRKTQKNHIRAARDWLGQAEHSLDHENDVQGDLKLMLAKAELSRIQASPRVNRLKCWGIRVIPAVIAFAIAVGGWLVWQDVLRSDPATPAGSETVLAGSSETARSREPDQPVMQPVTDKTDPAPQAVDPGTAPQVSGAASVQASHPDPVSEASHQPVSQSSRSLVGTTPTPETQKLMQSAGKALRQ